MPFLDQLNPKQQEAITSVQGPVMVVAGPGSGKTRVLTYRIAHLVSIGVPSYQILALTFTNKAANEMRNRIVSLVGDKSRSLWMGTFHSILARVLRAECASIGYTRSFSIYDSQDSLALIRSVMKDLAISPQQFNPQAIRSRISGAKNQLVLPPDFAASDLFEEKTALVYSEYQNRLEASDAMDFDDLLLKPIEAFRLQKKLLEKYQERFRFILIDEYQDTNHAQYVLIKLLAQKYRNVCVVGDDAQSIYAFRGADIRNILDFQRDYPDSTIIRLEQNYRSTKTILAAADQVIKHNSEQIAKNLWTENSEGEKITLLSCRDDRDEGMAIVARIHAESRRLKLDLRDFAVMYRMNSQSRSLEDALNQNNIRYIMVGGVRFYERKEIKDVMAYLRLLVNPKDDESFRRIVNYPARGLGETAVARLSDFASSNSVSLLHAAARAPEIPKISGKARDALSRLAAMLLKYQSLVGQMSPSEISRALIEEIGILHLFKEEATEEAMARWENVQEILSAITAFTAEQPGAPLEDFLQEKSLLSDADEWDDKKNAVTLLTLHSAKGLEFPVVFITGLEEGLLPFSRSHTPDAADLEEERRLYYVGLTRAMRKLYLSYARSRYRFSEVSHQSPSRFITEIDDSLLESEDRQTSPTGFPPTARMARMRRRPAEVFSDPMPDYDYDSEEALRVGRQVLHEVFGEGKIVQLSGKGESLKAVVEFSTAGKKNLMLKYAHLKLL